ncbi:oxygenase MpaB family protein [Nocardia inohanensis]|uniref:oxygenase MpaB family protein n=1 Tax=Nocardia inohanensis TaxID=209246 RepID=UPI00083641F5|nr:oxygenase MpaB family protein [Nocardia inohanensis]
MSAVPHQVSLADDVRWFTGSPLAAVFGRLALDQVAYREIAAAVDRTGRFAENFTDRGLRSVAFTALMGFADPVDAQAFREDLKRLHRDVRGTGTGEFADTRYSALTPEMWTWVAVSGLNAIHQAYVNLCGRTLTADEQEIVYQTLRTELGYLELPGSRGKLPETLTEMRAYYDRVATTHLADNEFLQFARRSFETLPLPALFVPRAARPALTPLWRAATKLAARPVTVCSSGAAHPRMQQLLHVHWTPRHQFEYTLYTTLLGTAWRYLPRRLTLEPLAYNRYRYERLRDLYRSILLDSFAAPATRAA